jgi:hypothetical protein
MVPPDDEEFAKFTGVALQRQAGNEDGKLHARLPAVITGIQTREYASRATCASHLNAPL